MTTIASSFRWTCSYFGCVDYNAVHATGSYMMTIRHRAGDYEHSIFNGNEASWQRDIMASIGILYNHHYPDRPLPDDLVADFNRWRLVEHEQWIARMTADPHRYGDPSTFGDLAIPPMLADAGYYVTGQGWLRHSVKPA